MTEPQHFPGSIRLTIPASVDRSGFATYRTVVVPRRLLSMFGQIVENATHPRLLTQQYEVDGHAVAAMGDSMLDHLRERTQYDLEHGLREDAKKQGLAILTAITFDEQKLSGGGILFTAQATAMPLLDKGIEL